MNGWIVLLWSFVAALILIVVGIFVALVLMGRIELFPAAEPTIAPTPEVTGVVDTSYSVRVMNTTAEENLAVQMRDAIINSGWPAESVIYGDADSQDFADTTVYYVAEADELAAIGLADVIGGAEVVQDDFYADPNDPEQKLLVAVIGADRSTVAPDPAETPAE